MMSQIFIWRCSEVGYVYPLFGPVEYLSFSTLEKANSRESKHKLENDYVGKNTNYDITDFRQCCIHFQHNNDDARKCNNIYIYIYIYIYRKLENTLNLPYILTLILNIESRSCFACYIGLFPPRAFAQNHVLCRANGLPQLCPRFKIVSHFFTTIFSLETSTTRF